MVAGEPSPVARWALGPLLAWVSVLVSSLGALLLLAYVWTFGSAPWASAGSPLFLKDGALEIALVLPAVLALGGAALAFRLHRVRAGMPAGWGASASGTAEPGR